MTVETTSVFAGPFPTNGVATAFPFEFKALSSDEVRVEIDGAIVNPSLYTVSIAAQSGTATFGVAPPAGGALYVISDPDFRQGISFSNQSAFLPTSHNEANDRAAVRDQVLADGVARAIQLPLGEESPVLPAAADRANAVLGFDSSGQSVMKPIGSFPPGPAGGDANSYATVAEMQAAGVTGLTYNLAAPSGSDAGYVNGPFTYQTGNFTGRTDVVALDGVPLTTGALVRQKADSIAYVPPVGPLIASNEFNDRQGVFVGAGDEVQQAIDYLVTKGDRSPVKLAPGRVFTMPDETVTIDCSYSFIEGHGPHLDFRTMTGSKAAILVRGSENPPYRQGTNVFSRLRLLGPHTAQGSSTSTGIAFEGLVSGENGPSHVGMSDCEIESFAIGVRHGHNSYLNHNRNVRILGCDYGVDVQGSTINATENIRYTDGGIFNCTLAIRQADASGAGCLTVTGMSLDYNQKLAEIWGRAGIEFRDCYHEVAQYAQVPIEFKLDASNTNDGAYFQWNGGRFTIRDLGPTFPVWANVPAGANCEILADFASNTQTTLQTNFTGAGRSKWRTKHSFDLHRNNPIAHSVRTGLIDGNFAGGSVPPGVSITQDSSGITSPTAGANIQLSVTSDYPLNGPNSLKMNKVNGAGTQAGFILSAAECEFDDLMGGEFSYKKPGAQTGTLFIQNFWAVLTKSGNGNLEINYSENIGDLPITFTSAPVDWTQITFPGANLTASRKPRWATHRIVLITGVNMGAGPLYFGKRKMEVIG